MFSTFLRFPERFPGSSGLHTHAFGKLPRVCSRQMERRRTFDSNTREFATPSRLTRRVSNTGISCKEVLNHVIDHLIAVIAQVYRYRSVSTSRERQQTRWVVFGFVLAMLIFVGTRLIAFLLPPAILNSQVAASLIGGGSVYLALILILLFIGIAVFRSHLFDIDLIIKRTLVYGLLTAFVIGLYVLVVGYLGTAFRTNGNLLISLIATGLVAVLFQPLRGLLRRSINRLLYGLRDEPYVVLTGLGQRLKTTLNSDAVLPTIAATVREALKFSYTAIEVPEGGEFTLAAISGIPPAQEALRLPLVHQGAAVGTLLIAPRERDGALTPADLRLLDDLAQQNSEIAKRFTLSLKTVANHVSNIFSKLQVADRAQAIIRAREAGLG